ncbi:hypothetical protein GCM10023346_24420 [Arthrobacter gyeryongensis]|uniref:Uncharacterized protein n=1 Tax=Arthrobacter gyeryongensis TaxID=1650592 RepID=A0ABP9SF41_9MICC
MVTQLSPPPPSPRKLGQGTLAAWAHAFNAVLKAQNDIKCELVGLAAGSSATTLSQESCRG